MRGTGLSVLLAVTAVAVIGAAWAVRPGKDHASDPLVGTPVLPAIAQQLDEVGRLNLVHGDAKTTLVRHGDAWTVEERDDYPADAVKVRKTLLGLADLRYVEPKTHKAELYARLELEDAGKKGAKSTLITVTDEKGSLLGEVIAGKHRVDELGGGNDGVYVRKPGDQQSWLARGTLDLASDTPQWLDQKLIDIPEAKIKDVLFTAADGTQLALKRDKPADKFALGTAPPAGKKLKGEDALDEPAGALGHVELNDVRAAKDVAFPATGTPTARYETFDGLTITVTVVKIDKNDWIKLAASGTGDAEKVAAALNLRLAPWAFSVAEFKAKQLETKLDDLVEAQKGS